VTVIIMSPDHEGFCILIVVMIPLGSRKPFKYLNPLLLQNLHLKYAASTCCATLNPSNEKMYAVKSGKRGASKSSVRTRKGRAIGIIRNYASLMALRHTITAKVKSINVLHKTWVVL